MRSLISVVKLTLIFVFLVLFLLNNLMWFFAVRNLKRRRQKFTQTASRYAKIGMKILGIRIQVLNPPEPGKHFLLVGNHLGVLEIMGLASVYPTLFVTSQEMRETFGLGVITEIGGCIFVERRDRSKIDHEVLKIREALQQELSVMLYAEATSSDGAQVLPFKRTLMKAAAGVTPIKPVVTNFRKVNGEDVSHKYRKYVCWYGDMSFAATMFRVGTLKRIDLEFDFCPEIPVKTEEERVAVAEAAYNAVVSRYKPIEYPPGVQSDFKLPESLRN